MKTITTKQVKEVLQELKHALSKPGQNNLKCELELVKQNLKDLFNKIEYRGHPVQNDLERAIVIAVILTTVGCAPTLISLHYLLRKLGRNGFRYDKIIKINLEAFQKRE